MIDTRIQIRNRIKEILDSRNELTGRIYYDYLYAINEKNLPSLFIKTGQEDFNNISLGNPFVIEKTLRVTIALVTMIKGNFQDTLDDLKRVIEDKINETNTLEGLVQSCFMESVEPIEVDDDRDIPLAYTSINLLVTYRVYSNNITSIV